MFAFTAALAQAVVDTTGKPAGVAVVQVPTWLPPEVWRPTEEWRSAGEVAADVARVLAWWEEFWRGMGPAGVWLPQVEVRRARAAGKEGGLEALTWADRDHVGGYDVELEHVGPGLREGLDWVGGRDSAGSGVVHVGGWLAACLTG